MIANSEIKPFISSTILLRPCFCGCTLSAVVLLDSPCFVAILEITCSIISVQSNKDLRLLSDSQMSDSPMFGFT